MTDRSQTIAIIGAGLSGLYAAYLLQQQGYHHFQVFEARAKPGGRIASFSPAAAGYSDSGHFDSSQSNLGHFDLGPTWYWPELQPEFHQLIAELGLTSFRQQDDGDLLVDAAGGRGVMRYAGYRNELLTLRLQGGMFALISALLAKIPADKIAYQQVVRAIALEAQQVKLTWQSSTPDQSENTKQPDVHAVNQSEHMPEQAVVHASLFDKVIVAMPPRLLASTIDFSPALPASLQQAWQQTATWMAPHAKFVAVYETAFWRAEGLSGAARSQVGPMVELHDASLPQGAAALFGFIGIPAGMRAQMGEQQLKAQCQAQLIRLFGEQAAKPLAIALQDWAAEAFTATHQDRLATPTHPEAPEWQVRQSPWQHKLVAAGSEWSTRYAGYLAGCIDAATRAVNAVTKA